MEPSKTRRLRFWFWVVVVAVAAWFWPWTNLRLVDKPAAKPASPISPPTK
jgi:hypothetical protein